MAASDSQPQPKKNTALRITFGMWLTTGLVNTGAAGLDSEVSKDDGTFADCTSEATEVATSSGTYYLDLTATEMDADVVAIQVKSSTTNAITYKCTIYPTSVGDWGVKLDDGVAHGGTLGSSTATLGLSRLSIVSQSSNTSALTITGNGTGHGLAATSGSGATGNGITALAASTNGIGFSSTGTGSGHGIFATTGGSGDGIHLTSVGGNSMTASGSISVLGVVTFNTFTVSNNVTVSGTTTFTGNVAMANGLTITRSSSNTSALTITGNGTGHGIIATSGSGATGDGIRAVAASSAGRGMFITGAEGLRVTGATSFNAINADAVAFTDFNLSNLAISGNLTVTTNLAVGGTSTFTGGIIGNITGNLSGSVGSVTGAVGSVTGAVGSVTGNVGGNLGGNVVGSVGSVAGNVTGSVGSIASGGITSASFSTTAGSINALSIVDQGQAQAATSTTLRLRATAAFADDELIGARILITGGTTGVGQSAAITDYTNATDTATIAAWPAGTPTGTITYMVFSSTPSGGGSGLSAQQTRDAMQLSPTGVTQTNSIDFKLDALAAGSGSGAYPINVTVTDGTDPLQNALVRVIEGINTFTVLTDVNGEGTFSLDAATWTVAVFKDGYAFTPTTRTVTGIQSGTLINDLVLSQVAPNPPPAEPNMCVIYGYIRDMQTLEMIAGVNVTVTLSATSAFSTNGAPVVGRSLSAQTNSAGYFSISVPKNNTITPSGTTYLIECDDCAFQVNQACNTDTLDIGTLIT